MFFMCDFTLQHQTRAQLDMRRSLEPQMTRSLYSASLPFAKHWISIKNEHQMTPPSRCLNSRHCAVKPRVSCEFHSLLGSHRAQHSVHIAESHPDWRPRLLRNPLVSSQLACRLVERDDAASARRGLTDGESVWGAPEGESRRGSLRVSMLHREVRRDRREENWRTNLWVAYYVAKGAGFVLGRDGWGALTLFFALLL